MQAASNPYSCGIRIDLLASASCAVKKVAEVFLTSCRDRGGSQFIYTKLTLLSPMAGTVKKTVAPVREDSEEDIRTLLEGTDTAWAQYKQGQGKRITSSDELDAFLENL